jgi:hypothetical protein
MRSAFVLVALGWAVATGSLCRADELPPPVAMPGDHAVPLLPAPEPGPPPHQSCCQRLWQWLTYHPLPSACACGGCCKDCTLSCRPPLYQYFLWEHPGCGDHGCGHPPAAPAPVEATMPSPDEAPTPREWRSDAGDLPAPQIVPQGSETGMRRYVEP